VSVATSIGPGRASVTISNHDLGIGRRCCDNRLGRTRSCVMTLRSETKRVGRENCESGAIRRFMKLGRRPGDVRQIHGSNLNDASRVRAHLTQLTVPCLMYPGTNRSSLWPDLLSGRLTKTVRGPITDVDPGGLGQCTRAVYARHRGTIVVKSRATNDLLSHSLW
jgi:hypothetical protein